MSSSLSERVGEHYLFAPMPAPEVERLLQHCSTVTLSNDESLFHQGDSSSHFYIVLSGSIRLFRLAPDGQSKVIEVIHQGEPFAEALMFLDKTRYPVNAVALGETEVLAVPCDLYKDILLRHPRCGLKLMGNMAMKLHKRITEIETLTLQNTRHRLGNYLFGLAADPAAECCEIELPMAKQLIASQLGMQPETLSRLLKEMKQLGLIEGDGSLIRVNNLAGLRAFGH